MRFDPTMMIGRMVVERNGSSVYDERFHPGINVIRGENSSGKSTVLNFLFYGLGGDLTDWSEAAQRCSRVFVEVTINGIPATFARNISTERGQPMDIFGGDYEAAKIAAIGSWHRYPYARSENIESFSQAIFRLLGLPDVASETSGHVTVHQVLRLLYADQLSPVESLFKFERFDPPNLRESIGRLLCGAYDNVLYSNELRVRTLQKELDELSSELRSLVALLGQAEQSITLEWAHDQERSLTQELESTRTAIEEAERQIYASATHDALTLKAQEQAYSSVQKLQEQILLLRRERDEVFLEMADSQAFISSLNSKLKALREASAVAEHIGDVTFRTCPACHAPIHQQPSLRDRECHLCNTPFDSSQPRNRVAALINDTALQVRQSQSLQKKRELRAAALNSQLGQLEESWQTVSARFAELRRLPSSEQRERLRELQRRAGYLERRIEDQKQKSKLAAVFNARLEARGKLQTQIERLNLQNRNLRNSQETRLARAYSTISDEIRWLLHNDLRRQDSFETASEIQFDFGANHISVDGQTYFSASSRVILKSSFFLGFLAASAKNESFRHPRFCIVDTIEDKGMEVLRSHNFQRLALQLSEQLRADHQIIFATAMIAPELDNDRFTVGKYSTRDSPTLTLTHPKEPNPIGQLR